MNTEKKVMTMIKWKGTSGHKMGEAGKCRVQREGQPPVAGADPDTWNPVLTAGWSSLCVCVCVCVRVCVH